MSLLSFWNASLRLLILLRIEHLKHRSNLLLFFFLLFLFFIVYDEIICTYRYEYNSFIKPYEQWVRSLYFSLSLSLVVFHVLRFCHRRWWWWWWCIVYIHFVAIIILASIHIYRLFALLLYDIYDELILSSEWRENYIIEVGSICLIYDVQRCAKHSFFDTFCVQRVNREYFIFFFIVHFLSFILNNFE